MSKTSILEGCDMIVDQELLLPGIAAGKRRPHYTNKETMLNLIAAKKLAGTFESLCYRCFGQIEENFKLGQFRPSSTGNWRWRKKTQTEHDLEVALERAIVKLDDTWANQIATASGLMGQSVDKRRAIDLVRHLLGDTYQFIELKVASNTPISAAIELLEYALLYVFARERREALGIAESERLMSAKRIELRVLAPAEFFTDAKRGTALDLQWFEEGLNLGISKFCTQRGIGVAMDFQFLRFGEGFVWALTNPSTAGADPFLAWLRAEVKDIQPLYERAK